MLNSVSNNQFHFRLAQLTDVQQIVLLVNSAYRGEISKIGWTTEADLLGGQRVDAEAIENCIKQKNSVILIAENSVSKILACVQLQKIKPEVFYLGMLTVSPELQNSGLGKILLKNAEDWVINKANGQNHTGPNLVENESSESFNIKIEMTVIKQRTELINWYIRRGYLRTGEMRPFPYGDERFGLPKRNDLEFEVLEKKL